MYFLLRESKIWVYLGSFWSLYRLFWYAPIGVHFSGPNSLVVQKILTNIGSGSPHSASRGCGEECLCLQYTLSPLLDRTRENTTLFPIVLSIVLHGIVHCCSFFAFSCQLYPMVNLVFNTGVQNFLYQDISSVIYFLCWHILSQSFIQPRKSLMARNDVNEYHYLFVCSSRPLYGIFA